MKQNHYLEPQNNRHVLHRAGGDAYNMYVRTCVCIYIVRMCVYACMCVWGVNWGRKEAGCDLTGTCAYGIHTNALVDLLFI